MQYLLIRIVCGSPAQILILKNEIDCHLLACDRLIPPQTQDFSNYLSAKQSHLLSEADFIIDEFIFILFEIRCEISLTRHSFVSPRTTVVCVLGHHHRTKPMTVFL